jgi:hypothetical protein|tara:strand:- start:1302 stop:1442 length:141 start_codon:yes stop_codon:yes gene_type:complete
LAGIKRKEEIIELVSIKGKIDFNKEISNLQHGEPLRFKKKVRYTKN